LGVSTVDLIVGSSYKLKVDSSDGAKQDKLKNIAVNYLSEEPFHLGMKRSLTELTWL
jgi:hypothetical protein